MPATKRESANVEAHHHRTGIVTSEFDQINRPGLYLENRTGALFRIPQDALVSGRSPALEILCNEPCIVTKISDDPFVPVTKARMLAADLDLQINF